MANFLEQLVCEWHEYRDYFVRHNVKVGLRPQGGFEAELDVVAFHPGEKRLVHYETSTDADSWAERDKRFWKKFDSGRKHIPEIFKAFAPLPELEQVALFVFGSAQEHPEVGGGRVKMVKDLMVEIRQKLITLPVAKSAIPEQHVILRALQFANDFWQ
jgi:hypothetical protein